MERASDPSVQFGVMRDAKAQPGRDRHLVVAGGEGRRQGREEKSEPRTDGMHAIQDRSRNGAWID